jgi:hypothetical protein
MSKYDTKTFAEYLFHARSSNSAAIKVMVFAVPAWHSTANENSGSLTVSILIPSETLIVEPVQVVLESHA